MKLTIFYEDNHLIAVEKPAGLITQDDYTGNISLISMIKEYIRRKYNKPGRVFLATLHRLDRPVSGVVLFAKTSKGAERINRQFRERSIIKFYAASVFKGPGLNTGGEWHTLENRITREHDISRAEPADSAEGLHASLRYRVTEIGDKTAFVIIELITGRKHQIRAQFAAISSPVEGDTKYGYSGTTYTEKISLHSCYIGFRHPVKGDFTEIHSPVPDRMILPGIKNDSVEEQIAIEIEKKLRGS